MDQINGRHPAWLFSGHWLVIDVGRQGNVLSMNLNACCLQGPDRATGPFTQSKCPTQMSPEF